LWRGKKGHPSGCRSFSTGKEYGIARKCSRSEPDVPFKATYRSIPRKEHCHLDSHVAERVDRGRKRTIGAEESRKKNNSIVRVQRGGETCHSFTGRGTMRGDPPRRGYDF